MARANSEFSDKSVQGFFVHDEPNPQPVPAIPPRFGLKNEASTRWQTFFDHLHVLNAEDPKTSYKFFLLSRHGQGYHNVGESEYGTEAWDEYWSKLNGDGEIIWGPDPQLTSLGINQAKVAKACWAEEAAVGLPFPDRRYTSPLSRAMDTCSIMFDNVYRDRDCSHPVVVLENCREENGVHTCDRRKTRSYIAKSHPSFTIEEGFTEEDELWNTTVRETKAEVSNRACSVIDKIFREDLEAKFISITAHGGFINGFLTAVGRPPYSLPTGGVLPIMVKRILQ